jgi:hypothetical protein
VRRRRWAVVLAVAVTSAAVTLGVVHLVSTGPSAPLPGCTIGTGPAALLLSTDQAANATTIAAAAEQLGLPDHAVTVALATALEESKLHNYPFGDRDSLGLFQQRPSQGWGTPAQLLNPAYAARAFFRHLAAVPGWESDPVEVAAQAVQHSADGSAYAQWTEQARAMARVVTGEVAHGLSCQFPGPRTSRAAALRVAARHELGAGVLTASAPTAAVAWRVAMWLVAHADGYGVTSVMVRGYRWTCTGDGWHRVSGRPTDRASYTTVPTRR